MKINNTILYIILYFVFAFLHYIIWQYTQEDHLAIFIRYYLFLSFLFIFVITILTLFHRIYPGYTGFIFMGLIFLKLSLIFVLMSTMKFSGVPNFKLHFIPPYLISLMLETLFAVQLLKNDKNH